jgi:hypothetical protein
MINTVSFVTVIFFFALGAESLNASMNRVEVPTRNFGGKE